MKDTSGIIGRFILAIGVAVMIAGIDVAYRLNLVEKVVNPMGCRVQEEKQERGRAKRISVTGDSKPRMVANVCHLPGTPPNSTLLR